MQLSDERNAGLQLNVNVMHEMYAIGRGYYKQEYEIYLYNKRNIRCNIQFLQCIKKSVMQLIYGPKNNFYQIIWPKFTQKKKDKKQSM